MVRSKSIKRTLLKRVACALVMIVMVLSLVACGSSNKSDGPTRADYNEMIKVININDDYDWCSESKRPKRKEWCEPLLISCEAAFGYDIS